MQKIKLWRVDESGQVSAQEVHDVEQVDAEEKLEDLLVQSPQLLMDDLTLIGRQVETSGGPLDLLGVDGDGALVVFELKRGTLTRDAVSQIVDYASYLAEMEPENLSAHVSERSGHDGIEKIDNFAEWYREQFGKSIREIGKPSMVLVGLGVDDRARRMVEFLADSDLDISLITFHGFKEDGQILLARQVEVTAKVVATTGVYSKKNNLEKLQQNVRECGFQSFYFEMAEFFRDAMPGYEWPNPTGFSYYLADVTESGSATNRVYIALFTNKTHCEVRIHIHPRAMQAAGESLEQLKTNVETRVSDWKDGSIEAIVRSKEEWEKSIESFRVFIPALIEGWKNKRQAETERQLEEIEQEVGEE